MSGLTPPGHSRVHVWISGRVQGVGYRYATTMQAQRFSLGGWVRNLGDGRVEAVFEGPAAEVARVVHWCKTGPPGAWVAEVQTAPELPVGDTTFRTLQTDFRGESS